jgi:hypothetical protein
MSTIYFLNILSLGLVRSVTFTFLSFECMYMLYFTLIRYMLEYASVVLNPIASTEANKLECIQQHFQPSVLIVYFPMSIIVLLMLYNS